MNNDISEALKSQPYIFYLIIKDSTTRKIVITDWTTLTRKNGQIWIF